MLYWEIYFNIHKHLGRNKDETKPCLQDLRYLCSSWELQNHLKISALKQTLANDSRLAHSGLPPVVVNQVLLEHSHTHLFMYYVWLLLCYNGKVE